MAERFVGLSRKEIKPIITQEDLLEVFKYDAETGSLTWRKRPLSHFTSDGHFKRWNKRYAGTLAFLQVDKDGYLAGTVYGLRMMSHRVIWMLVFGEWPENIDHINGVRHDNRLKNLRNVSCSENSKNMRMPIKNKSGQSGVCWHKREQKWYSQIKFNKKMIHLGCFDDFNDAVIARKAAELKYGFHENHGRSPHQSLLVKLPSSP